MTRGRELYKVVEQKGCKRHSLSNMVGKQSLWLGGSGLGGRYLGDGQAYGDLKFTGRGVAGILAGLGTELCKGSMKGLNNGSGFSKVKTVYSCFKGSGLQKHT